MNNRFFHRALACWLALSLAAACLPDAVSRQLQDHGRWLLAPGQRLAWTALKSLRRWGLVWRQRGDAAEEIIVLRDRVRRLDDLNLALRAASSRGDFSLSAGAEQPPPLIGVRAVETRVLGRQAQAFLQQAAVIATGQTAELTADSMALDGGEALVDQGGNVALAASDLAVAGARVWGKVIEVGPQTALVRRVNAMGYRGLVEIVHDVNGVRRPLAQGVLQGTGDALCRIRMVDATAPISVGDLVLAGEEQGVTKMPLIYGRIASAELEPGAPHWQLWMAPAIAGDLPTALTVLQPEMNQERIKVAGTLRVP